MRDNRAGTACVEEKNDEKWAWSVAMGVSKLQSILPGLAAIALHIKSCNSLKVGKQRDFYQKHRPVYDLSISSSGFCSCSEW